MNKTNKTIAIAMLGLMFILMFFSSWNDSATMDEEAHIPSGYSYLTQQDYRLNPEHPPLIKDLAALPLLFLNLNFPTNVPEWTNFINGQWDMGRIFLYESGNNADKILHFSRFPIMLLALLFGWMLFKWASQLYGNKVGLLTLFFYSFSPTIIAHSRYVTTDLGAAFGFFIGLSTFINFLNHQTKKNLIIAGVAFGIAQLLKFSLVILAPIYILLAILWVILEKWSLKSLFKIISKIILIGIIGLLIIWPLYQFHVWHYPPERQMQDTKLTLTSFSIRPLANFVIWLSDKPVLRALGQYLFGVLMVMQRATGGNTAYFLGTVSAIGTPVYFPLLYLLKEPLAFHILTLIAIIFAIRNIIKAKEKNIKVIAEWMRDNFAITASIIFITIYFLQAITSNLNIGVRHILPTLPFIYFLTARQIIRWTKTSSIDEPQNFFQWIKNIYHTYIKSLERYLLVCALMFWMFLSTIAAFPYYLSYYNILGGGLTNGYKISVDSNYDWGQDLKRLRDWTKSDFEFSKSDFRIAIDYFGGGNPKYYFGDKFVPWQSSKGPPNGWFAVSTTFLQTDSYSWLKNKTPVARAGTSIFIYKF